MIFRAYSEPNLFIIGIPCIPPTHDRDGSHARVRGSYECLVRDTFESPTKIFTQPPSSENFCELLEVSRNSGDSNVPRKHLRSNFCSNRPHIVFLISKKHHWVLLIILSSTK